MQKLNIKNILLQALNPQRLQEILNKIRIKFFDKKGSLSQQENLFWIQKNCDDFEELAAKLDYNLWQESIAVSEKIKNTAQQKLLNISYKLGGGGIYPFLYFITRYLNNVDCIVETGVAAGFSSYAFLEAIEINGRGKLYSSDFPYFRLPDPEKFIGIIVDDSLKNEWSLYLDGDRNNLPLITSQVELIDIFHYDSDKSYSGREFALSLIEKKMKKKGIILMDDIQDNSFFYDYVISHAHKKWMIFEFNNKYVGMIGKLSD